MQKNKLYKITKDKTLNKYNNNEYNINRLRVLTRVGKYNIIYLRREENDSC